MDKTSCILVFMTWIAFIKCQMEPFVVGGEKVHINNFPHSAYIFVTCKYNKEQTGSWSCGGSIVNEKIILTAAHCLFGCTSRSLFTVFVGHHNKKNGHRSSVDSYITHENYNDDENSNDIALMKLTTSLKFDKNVKRVALMKDPPYCEKAQIAGWGITNEDTNRAAVILKYVDQYVWKMYACKQVLRSIPAGTICASSGNATSYSSQ